MLLCLFRTFLFQKVAFNEFNLHNKKLISSIAIGQNGNTDHIDGLEGSEINNANLMGGRPG